MAETLQDLLSKSDAEISNGCINFVHEPEFLPTIFPRLITMHPVPYHTILEIQTKIPQHQTIITKTTLQLIIRDFDKESMIAFSNFIIHYLDDDLCDILVTKILNTDSNAAFILLQNLVIHYYKIDKQKTVNLIDQLLRRNGQLKVVTIYELLKREIYVDVLVKYLLNLEVNSRLLNQIFLLLLKLKRLENYFEKIYHKLISNNLDMKLIREYNKDLKLSTVNIEQIDIGTISQVIMSTLTDVNPKVLELAIIDYLDENYQEEEEQEVEIEVMDISIDVDKILSIKPNESALSSIIGRIITSFSMKEASGDYNENNTVAASNFGHILVICRLLTKVSSKENYIQQVMEKSMDLLIYWLFEEYLHSNYYDSLHKVLDLMKATFASTNRAFTKFLIEIPDFDDFCLNRVVEYCNDKNYYPLGLTTLRDLCIFRPATRNQCLERLLMFSSSLEYKTRAISVMHLKKLLTGRNIPLIYNESEKLINELYSFNEETENLEKIVYSKLDLYLSLCLIKPEMISRFYQDAGKLIAKVKELLRPALKATALELLQNENTQVLLNLAERFYQDAELFNVDLLELMLQNEKLQEKATEIIQTLWNDKRATVSALNLILKKLDADVSMSYLEQIVSHLNGPEDSAAAVSLALLCKNEGEVLVSLMVALHRLDKKVPIKKVEKAINLFLKESSQYSQSVMSVVIPKLASEPILSSLITRTYYLSCLSYPELIPITNTALSSLIRKLWKNELLWGDFVYYCQKLFPQTVDLIITLTPKMLDRVLSGLGPQIDEYFKNNRALLNNPRYRVLRQQINK